MIKKELLYHYFSGTLTVAQELEFNELLKKDSAFKKQFEFEKNLKVAIKKKQHQILKTKLQNFEQEIELTKQPTTTKLKLWMAAASIVLLVSAGWYFQNLSTSIDYKTLYATNYSKYPNTIYSITRDSVIDTSLVYKAFEAYEASDYSKSITLFQELKNTNNPEYVDFYLAQAYLNNHQLDKAIDTFKNIIKNHKEFSTESLWYLSLAYLKSEHPEKAKKALKLLVENGNYKKTESLKLLKKLS